MSTSPSRFYSLAKEEIKEKGKKKMVPVSIKFVLPIEQIARFKLCFLGRGGINAAGSVFTKVEGDVGKSARGLMNIAL